MRGATFVDPGFRLAVIDALWNLGHFKKELAAARAQRTAEDHAIDPGVRRVVDAFVLSRALLAEVTALAPDGGDEIYDALVPGWDGENEALVIHSLEDVKLLPNLTRVSLYAMCALRLDLRPLAGCAKLTKVNIGGGKQTRANARVLAALAKRGVVIT